jgi:heme-degrading monooxygenase HmoA
MIIMVKRDYPPTFQVGERRYAIMHARMSTLEGSPDEMDEGLREVKERVLPLLQQQEGFKGFIALGNRQSGELIGITFWESEQTMQASEEVGDRTRSDTAEDTGDTVADVERYEVGLFEMSD